MADPKKPDGKETTRPVPSVSDRTEPIAQGSELTRPTISITRPTVVFSKESTRPVDSIRSATGARPPSARTPVVGKRSSTRTPAVRRTGSVGRVSQAGPAVRPDLMTEGMRAHRRDIERKRRRAALERMRLEEELSEGWRRVFKTAGFILLVLALGYGYFRVQQTYGDQWPLMAVWLMMAAAILTAFGWILWYMNKGDI